MTIKRRFISVSLTILISALILFLSDKSKLWHVIPHEFRFVDGFVIPILLISTLFLGPIYLFIKEYDHSYTFHPHYLLILRNYVVAPISEEIIFRGIIIEMIRPCLSNTALILVSSLLFSVCHLHHYLFQSMNGMGNGPQDNKILLTNSICQMCFTFLFALYASSLYLKTNYILSPIVLHSMCNIFGFPDFETLMSTKNYIIVTFAGFIIWMLLSAIYLFS